MTQTKLAQILEESELFHAVKSASKAPETSNLDRLKELARHKYALIITYIHLGDQLRDKARDGIYAHFNTHLNEEREQLYQINKKVTALGGDVVPSVTLDHLNGVDLADAKAMFETIKKLELDSVRLWSDLFRATSADVALNGLAQNYAVECQGHADDMARYLRGEK